MSWSGRNPNPIDALGGRIAELESQVRDLSRPRPLQVPVRPEDPDESDPTNLWMLPDGRLRGRHLNVAGDSFVYREWVATAPGGGTSGTAPAPAAPAPVTSVANCNATWSRSYRQNGAARTDDGVTKAYYGYADSFNGRNRSLIGFDHAGIAALLAGSTITAVRFRMFNLHSWLNSGSDIYLGIHNFSGVPGSWAGGGIPSSMAVKVHAGNNSFVDVPLPLNFAACIRDGWGKGIALEAPSNSNLFYGYVAGVGSGYSLPQLIITLVK